MRFLIIYFIFYNTKCNLGCRVGLSKGGLDNDAYEDSFLAFKHWKLPPQNDDWWGFVNLLGSRDPEEGATVQVTAANYDTETNFPWAGIGPGETVFKPPLEAKVINFIGQSSACLWDPDRGNGSTWQLRWYYETYTDKCKRFVYSGSGGNTNRWLTEWHCNQGCRVPQKSPACVPDKLFNYKDFVKIGTPKYPTA